MDLNDDGIIQVSEAERLDSLDFFASQCMSGSDTQQALYLSMNNLNGIEHFVNLEYLNIKHAMKLNSIDLTGLKKLRVL